MIKYKHETLQKAINAIRWMLFMIFTVISIVSGNPKALIETFAYIFIATMGTEVLFHIFDEAVE